MRLLASLTFLVLCLSSCNQRASDRFIDNHKNANQVYTVSVPGWLIRKSNNLFADFSREEDENIYHELISYLDGVRVMVSTGTSKISTAEIKQLNTDLRSKDKMESYASIKSQEGIFDVLVEEDARQIKNLTILVNQDGKFVIARINCHIPKDIFKAAKFSFNKKPL